jgi:hypothetical protein
MEMWACFVGGGRLPCCAVEPFSLGFESFTRYLDDLEDEEDLRVQTCRSLTVRYSLQLYITYCVSIQLAEIHCLGKFSSSCR